MKFKIPDELRELLASAPPHPNPNALNLFSLRIGTKIRYATRTGNVFNGWISGPPFEDDAGKWSIGIEVYIVQTYGITRFMNWSLYEAGLVPARLVDGKYDWCEPGFEYQNSIKRFLHRFFNARVDIEPDALFDYSPS